jgi:carboxymethylenebutenolidase
MTDPIPVPYFLAQPAVRGPWPGVVVVMEGNGMSPQLLRVCQRLAAEGYAAIAPDLFHRFGGSDPNKLPDQVMALRSEDALADLSQSAETLRALGATKLGITGFCMGGRLTYYAATHSDVFDAAAPFYGAGISKLLGDARCPLLCFFGDNDEYVSHEEIEAVEARHPGQVVVYPGAEHGFMRDGSDSYHEAAATDAWAKLLAFFGEHLR